MIQHLKLLLRATRFRPSFGSGSVGSFATRWAVIYIDNGGIVVAVIVTAGSFVATAIGLESLQSTAESTLPG